MASNEYNYLEKGVEEANYSSLKAKEAGDGNGKERGKSEKVGKRRYRTGGEEFDDDEERGRRRSSKKLRGEDYGRGRDKERVRDRYRDRDMDWSSRHRNRNRERERNAEIERRSSRYKEKEKDRDRGRERERKERDREKERRYRDTNRTRLERERGRDDGRRLKYKKEAVEPEADPERDRRTVFASNIPLKASNKDVFDFFSPAGKVRDVRVSMDKTSGRSNGVWYIEFFDAMFVPMAIALSGKLLLGEPIMVKPSEAGKNLVQSNTSTGSSADRKLYVSNLHFNVNEIYLKQIFENFGTVENVYLPTNQKTGQRKGFGFIQFAQIEHAKAAQSLNGREIGGRTIKVSSCTDHIDAQASGIKTADFDDRSGGQAFDAQARAMLTADLDRTGVSSSVVGSLGVPTMNRPAPSQQAISLPTTISTPALPAQVTSMAPEPIGNPTECLLLKNLFDPVTEMEFDDIRDDVEEECLKHGRLTHIHVDKNSAGYVYLRFESVKAATKAQEVMHNRWFAQRTISAIFLQPSEYDAKFK